MKEKPKELEERLEKIYASLEENISKLNEIEEELSSFLDDAQVDEFKDAVNHLADAAVALACV